jgi:small subunit ribosomal protein S7
MMNLKVMGKWDTSQIKVIDPGLKDYINTQPIYVPRTNGRHTKVQFHKNKINIVERLMNKLMMPGHRGKKHKLSSGHCGGKSLTAYKIVEKAFDIIETKTKENPVQVLVKAIETSSPRDEITTLEYGGARYPQAVDCAPQRRVDLTLRMFVQGAYQKSFGKKIKAWDALADEILLAAQQDPKSAAFSKRIELERQADAAR